MKHVLTVDKTGTITTLGNPLGLPCTITSKRWSTIVPFHQPERAAFKLLRWVFGDKGYVAQWTRTWKVLWICTILNNGLTQLSRNRTQLVAWEHEQYYEQQTKKGVNL